MKKQVSFRLSEQTIEQLDAILKEKQDEYEQFVKAVGVQPVKPNRTMIIESLIRNEYEQNEAKK